MENFIFDIVSANHRLGNGYLLTTFSLRGNLKDGVMPCDSEHPLTFCAYHTA